jgi:hypothetical protein
MIFHPIAALVSFLFCDPQFRNEFSLGSASTCSPIVRADRRTRADKLTTYRSARDRIRQCRNKLQDAQSKLLRALFEIIRVHRDEQDFMKASSSKSTIGNWKSAMFTLRT